MLLFGLLRFVLCLGLQVLSVNALASGSTQADTLTCLASRSLRLQSGLNICRELNLLLNRTRLDMARSYSLSISLADSFLDSSRFFPALHPEQLIHFHLHLLRIFKQRLHDSLTALAAPKSRDFELFTQLYHVVGLHSLSCARLICFDFDFASNSLFAQDWFLSLQSSESIRSDSFSSRARMSRFLFLSRFWFVVTKLQQQYQSVV